MSFSSRFEQSRSTVTLEGKALLDRTRTATRDFIAQTRKASIAFSKSAKKAGSSLAKEAQLASSDFASALRSEGAAWQAFLQAESARPFRVKRPELKLLVSVETLEKRVLTIVRGALGEIGGRVEGRLSRSNKTKKGAKKPTATGKAPIAGYAKLSAKDIVTKMSELSSEQVQAVIEYEQKNKQRASIIKAAAQRLAA